MSRAAGQDRTSTPVGNWDAVLVAAGRGERMGLGYPKARALLGGVPLFLHSLRTLRTHPGCDRIVIVHASEDGERELMRRWVEKDLGLSVRELPDDRSSPDPSTRVFITRGGEERQDSVWAGLNALAGLGTAEGRVVLVHDAARPLAGHPLIARCLEALGAQPTSDQEELPGLHRGIPGPVGVVPGMPVQETLKVVFEGRVVLTQPRENLYAVQTPQVFRFWPLLESHRRARRYGVRATDDAALLERDGTAVLLVAGDALNIKVTLPADLELAERLIGAGRT